MVTERVQRQIDTLLDEAEAAIKTADWELVRERARAVLRLNPGDADAVAYLAAAERDPDQETAPPSGVAQAPPPATPNSFVNGRYTVKRFLGEGGKKRVYLAHDTMLARDVAFALIRTDGLDAEGRERITREAQAMGRLGTHPHIVAVFDTGVEGGSPLPLGEGQGEGAPDTRRGALHAPGGAGEGTPYLVTELMAGGDIEALLEKAEGHRLPIQDALNLALQITQGLEFAHAHDLVHRDLKPGNVWLTGPGMRDEVPGTGATGDSKLETRNAELTAKIGDFGLAVSLDRSRLTRAGMMVGTVAYMPPEQAMGGDVSPRSDLYSLGAMLYEMVCGRPPFVGEESVAIITQHLNTPPITPSWHRPDIPAGLEALILRLLEKDASKRPGSAGEVRRALEGVSSSEFRVSSASDPDSKLETRSAELSDNPLYRRTFVGREAELRQLQAAFDGAVSGQGALVMVVGEPGIGKTALCEQLATYVAVRGGKALVGHCYEEGSLNLPYLPFVEAIRSYVLAATPEKLGSGAGDVARIVSEIRGKVDVEPRAASDPEDDRWRLYQALTSFLRSAGNVQPLVIVLEDLHWADRGTLDFLVHLSRNLQGSRLLLAGTYRDIEVDRNHPLSASLAELRRGLTFSRVSLRGLTPDEVQRMLDNLSGQQTGWSLAEAVHRQTEGNPLFVQEVVRYFVEEGLLTREGSPERASGAPLTMSIPEGLRDVIGKRLSRLSPECNRLLAVAAVVGREFRLETLRAVTGPAQPSLSLSPRTGERIPPPLPDAGTQEDALVGYLEEALRVGVLEERARVGSIEYRFAHAFFRQTLYEELSAARRLRLHQQVARALEAQYAGRVGEHAAELAEHFTQSTDPADLAKAVHYGELAAQRALAVYAHGEAVRLLEQTLEVQEVCAPEDTAHRCDLLLALGQALLPAGAPQRAAEDVAPRAFALAEALADPTRCVFACRIATEGLDAYAGLAARATRVFAEWAQRADRWAPPQTVERAWADMFVARSLLFSNHSEMTRLRRRTLDLARTTGDPQLLWEAARELLSATGLGEHEDQESLHLAQEFASVPGEGVSVRTRGGLLGVCLGIFLQWGERARAEELWQQEQTLAARSRHAMLVLNALRRDTVVGTLDGRLEAAVEAGERLLEQGEEAGSPGTARQYYAYIPLQARLHLGMLEAALAAAREVERFGGSLRARSVQAAVLAHLGRRDEAEDLLQRCLDARRLSVERDAPLLELVPLLETANIVGDTDAAGLLAELLRPRSHLASPWPDFTYIARHLGQAAVLLGEPEEARARYAEALAVGARVRNRPETALTRLLLAELLLAHYPEQRSEALAHLDFVIAEFQEMKMGPSLERALKHKGVLRA